MEKMKTLRYTKGISTINYATLTAGDVYDSVAELFSPDGTRLFYSEYVNMDHTAGYKGGILAKGVYKGIVGYRQNGARVIKFFKWETPDEAVHSDKDLTEEMVTLESSVPNPNHGGAMKISYVQGHAGRKKWDYSHGCFTHLNYGGIYEHDRLMNNLADDEIIKIEVA
jgi:hypothetical protein